MKKVINLKWSLFILVGVAVIAFLGTVIYLNRPYKDESYKYHNQRNVILAFIKPTCHHCNSIRVKVNEEKMFHKIIIIDVTKEKNSKLMDKFDITGTPTLVNVAGNGKVYKYKGTSAEDINKLIAYKH